MEYSKQAASPVAAHEGFQVLLYYKFVAVPNPELAQAEQQYLCQRLGLRGRIYVAEEGINGTVSGTVQATAAYQCFMKKHPLFKGIEFKVDEAQGHAFHRLSVKVKKELVAFDSPISVDPAHQPAPYLEPEEFRALLRNPPQDLVILDTRSRYETEVGRFAGAISLPIENFRDLPQQMAELEHLKDKTIVTYCTGGIRCEKAAPLMQKLGFRKVYQLHGGIIRYGHEVGGEHFEGRCYVFDERITVPVNHVNPTVVGHCHHCGKPNERVINCANPDCNDQVILCHACAEELHGCCSEPCTHAPHVRPYDGTGYYARPAADAPPLARAG